MSETTDAAQRTEEPTPKRLEEARRKGDAPKSQEAISAAMLGAAALSLWFLSPAVGERLMRAGAAFLDHPHAFETDPGALVALFGALARELIFAVGGVLALTFVAAALANVAQAAPVFTAARMKPSLSKISPLAGAKRVFGPTGLFNFAKGVAKLIVVGAILGAALWPDRHALIGLINAEAGASLATARGAALKIVGLAVAAMALVSALDYAYQRQAWRKRLRMTREEVRREQREQEGDPQIKARQRRFRETRARRRMVAAMEDATVLIMNPTHYAVALKYDEAIQAAARPPICVAKGLDDLALRLRAAAGEHSVPVIENPPLARALHDAVDVDDEIPLEHYEAVAKVIGFIMARAQVGVQVGVQGGEAAGRA